MNFNLTDDQQALRESVAKMLAAEYRVDRRRAALSLPAGTLPPVWTRLADMGLLALPLPEDHGGYGGTGFDLLPVLQEFGKALLVAPWLPVTLCAQAVAEAGSAAQMAAILPPVAVGRSILCWAGQNHDRANASGLPGTMAEPLDGGWRLTGDKCSVAYGPLADRFLVSARLPEGNGNALFLVDAQAAGLRRVAHRLMDGSFTADVHLSDAPAALLEGLPVDAHRGVEERLEQRGMAAVCAEALGVVEAAFELTVEYLGTRHQFGAALSANQSLQHRVADMYVALELVRSMSMQAADAVGATDAADRRRRLAQAKFVIGGHGRWIAQQAIQLHGAIGMTDECIVGQYYRRMLVIDHTFGDAEQQLNFLAALDAPAFAVPNVAQTDVEQ